MKFKKGGNMKKKRPAFKNKDFVIRKIELNWEVSFKTIRSPCIYTSNDRPLDYVIDLANYHMKDFNQVSNPKIK